jgi:hypothetical protein
MNDGEDCQQEDIADDKWRAGHVGVSRLAPQETVGYVREREREVEACSFIEGRRVRREERKGKA